MNRMTGQGDARGQSVGRCFLQSGHAKPTRGPDKGCERIARRAILVLPLIALTACSGEFSILDPAGPAAERVAALWQVMLWGSAAILALVMGIATYALVASRPERRFSNRRFLAGWGLAFPVATLAALMGFAFLSGERLLGQERDEEAIRVHAERWAWTFEYPGGERTTNVLHVPAGRDFSLAISSADVIHSFWIPRLGGKLDAIPGKLNRLRLRADSPGTYYGQCSEYCGTGHAHMQFEVRAHSPDEYAAALAAADDAEAGPLPVLDRRPPPAGDTISRWTDRLLEAIGLR